MPTSDSATRILYERIQAAIVGKDLRSYVKYAWPYVESDAYTWGWHIDAICDHLTAVSTGEIRNLLICIPPRCSKSLTAGVFWPTWEWIDRPQRKFLCTAYAQTLSVRDAVKSRTLIDSPWYQKLYADRYKLSGDMNLKTMYRNDKGGYRLSTSVDGTGTGEGGDIILVDDIHNLKEIYSDISRQGNVDYMTAILRTRLNDPKKSQKVMIMQRGHPQDAAGYILKNELDQWVTLILPLEYDPTRKCVTVLGFEDPRKKTGELLCPDRYGPDEVRNLKSGMTEMDFSAQFNQQPLFARGNIIKRSWWRLWDKDKPVPEFDLVIQSYDTAFEDDEAADCSARTTWGLFRVPVGNGKYETHALLLERMKKKLQYPDLYKEVLKSYQEYTPDWILVEKRASGHSLIQDMRRAGLPVKAVKKNIDKVAAAHLSSLIIEKGRVWYPDRKWAREVIDEVSAVPSGDQKDVPDTCFQAWAWIRRMGDVTYKEEDDDEIDVFSARRA